jgi:hypothetical protein
VASAQKTAQSVGSVSDVPEGLRDLDHTLRGLRFRPRSSFGIELEGRLRRGDQPQAPARRPVRRWWIVGAVIALATALSLAVPRLAFLTVAQVTVDRCCYDLDGGGDPDDGVLIVAERDAAVHQLRIYEDLDRSASYTPLDLVRLDRGRSLALHGMAGKPMVTIEQCCLDFDGGGPEDDGILVIGVPPDKILMAAIYERAEVSSALHQTGWLLR